MRVAIVHDTLSEFGGAERVLQSLIKLFPEADIFSSYASKTLLNNYFPSISHSNLKLSIIQNTPLSSHNSLLQTYSPLLWKTFCFDKYDLVISNSSYALSNLIRVKNSVHIQYINCPPKNLFGISPPRPLQRFFPYTKLIANFYKKAIHSSPYIIVNSKHMKKMIYNLFGISAKVIYPPVRIPDLKPTRHKPKYYFIVSRIDPTKKLELAIQACNYLKLPLRIVGETNAPYYERYLRSISGKTIEFLGKKTDDEIDELYKYAIAFLFTPENEDFGIAPVEAMTHGIPVIAYYGGGVKETIKENQTGLFFYKHTSESLVYILRRFDSSIFDSYKLYSYSKKFSEKNFLRIFNKTIRKIISS